MPKSTGITKQLLGRTAGPLLINRAWSRAMGPLTGSGPVEGSVTPVVFHAEVGYLFLSHQPPDGVLELRLLYKQVVLRVD